MVIPNAKKTNKVRWHWDNVHQKAFNGVKTIIAKDISLAYPDYSKESEIYTDASLKQMGAEITQWNRQHATYQDSMKVVFANCSEEDATYSLTVNEIVEGQQTNPHFTTLT